jgi:hypothetical protein
MCIIIVNKVGTIPYEQLEESWSRNDHGAGLAYVDNGVLLVYKTMVKEEFIHMYKSLKESGVGLVILHFRIRTHGLTDVSNVHPFAVNERLVLFHNGTIRMDYDKDDTPFELTSQQWKDMSDTAQFAVFLRYNFPINFTRSKKNLNVVRKLIAGYNKLVFLNHNNEVTFVNEHLGHWFEGNWYSNESYKPRPVVVYEAQPYERNLGRAYYDEDVVSYAEIKDTFPKGIDVITYDEVNECFTVGDFKKLLVSKGLSKKKAGKLAKQAIADPDCLFNGNLAIKVKENLKKAVKPIQTTLALIPELLETRKMNPAGLVVMDRVETVYGKGSIVAIAFHKPDDVVIGHWKYRFRPDVQPSELLGRVFFLDGTLVLYDDDKITKLT